MSKVSKSQERNNEIVFFFYSILGIRIHAGMNPDEARKEAYDAVSLRYNISKGRLLNIISSQRCSQIVNQSAFRENALSLIRELGNANKGLDNMKARNESLITLLKECIDNGL